MGLRQVIDLESMSRVSPQKGLEHDVAMKVSAYATRGTPSTAYEYNDK
jgi:hypothetical protein